MSRANSYLSLFLSKIKKNFIGWLKAKSIELSTRPDDGIHVFYGMEKIPSLREISKGGIIKFQWLSETFPNKTRKFNILYMVSSNYPAYAESILKATRSKKTKFLWNQNGVAYPAWMPSGWKEANTRMAGVLHNCDYVFYQSEFAKKSSIHFLGKPKGPPKKL